MSADRESTSREIQSTDCVVTAASTHAVGGGGRLPSSSLLPKNTPPTRDGEWARSVEQEGEFIRFGPGVALNE